MDKGPSSGGDEPVQNLPEDEKKVEGSAEPPKREPENIKKEPPAESIKDKPDKDEKPVISQNTRMRIKSGVPLGDAGFFGDLSVEKGGINKEPSSQGSPQEKDKADNAPVPTDLFSTLDANKVDKSQAFNQGIQSIPMRKKNKMPIPSIFQDMNNSERPDEKPEGGNEIKPAPEPIIQKKAEPPGHRFVRTDKIPDLFNDLWDDKKKDK